MSDARKAAEDAVEAVAKSGNKMKVGVGMLLFSALAAGSLAARKSRRRGQPEPRPSGLPEE